MADATAPARLSRPERRRRILEAAEETFASHGYESASVGEIATAAGITKPVLYDHFPSKRRLFVDLMESIRDELVSRGARAMDSDAPLETRIRAAVSSFFSYVADRPAAVRVLLVVPRGDPALLEAARKVQAGATAGLTALLAGEEDLLAEAPDRDERLELLTEFLKQGLHGLAEWWAEHPAVPGPVLVDATMDLAWRGLGAHLAPAQGAGEGALS